MSGAYAIRPMATDCMLPVPAVPCICHVTRSLKAQLIVELQLFTKVLVTYSHDEAIAKQWLLKIPVITVFNERVEICQKCLNRFSVFLYSGVETSAFVDHLTTDNEVRFKFGLDGVFLCCISGNPNISITSSACVPIE